VSCKRQRGIGSIYASTLNRSQAKVEREREEKERQPSAQPLITWLGFLSTLYLMKTFEKLTHLNPPIRLGGGVVSPKRGSVS
jgi:hypothetical protein